jgi:hypothetical protein
MKKLIPAASGGPEAAASEGTSRREFLAVGGAAAAGAAMIVATPRVASLATGGSGGSVPEPKAVVTEASGPAPAEPVTAFVRDAKRGEVTVLFGQKETTYNDPVLVKRLLDAAN